MTEPQMSAAPLPLEKYAALQAEVDAGAELEAVLKRETVSQESWLAAHAYWLKRMADEAQRSRFETTTRYQTLFRTKRKLFEAKFERDRNKRARAVPEAPVGVLAAMSAELAAPLRATPGSVEVPRPPEIQERSPPAVLPPSPAPAPQAPPQPVPIQPAIPERRAYVTMPLAADALKPPTATPFKPGAAVPPPPIPRDPRPAAKTDLSATLDGAAPSTVKATPFQNSGTERGTAPLDMSADIRKQLRDALPLKPALDKDDDEPRTKMVDADAVAAALAKATPFEAGRDKAREPDKAPESLGPASKPKRFSINVFASLTAEIAENPGDVEAIRTRYGLSEAEHREESERWTEEFKKSDDTRQRYFGIVQRYRGYIQQRKR